MLQPKTFLSPYVSELLSLVSSPNTPVDLEFNSCLDSWGLLDFDRIFSLLPPPSSTDQCDHQIADWYKSAVIALGPVWEQLASMDVTPAVIPAVADALSPTTSVLSLQAAVDGPAKNADSLQFDKTASHVCSATAVWQAKGWLAWVGCDWPQLEQLCPQLSTLHRKENQLGPLETILSICPLIEHGLGSLLACGGSSCFGRKEAVVPWLLRDILAARELEQLLSKPAVTFLQVLMGSPYSLNLRNLAWHGFPLPGELPPCLATALLLALPSIGRLVQLRGIRPLQLLPGYSIAQVQLMYASLCKLPRVPSGSTVAASAIDGTATWSRQLMGDLSLLAFPPLHDRQQPVLARIVEHVILCNFYPALVLALPLLESILRGLFVELNATPERLLTAESTRLYTTFEEIFSKSVLVEGVEKENKLIEFLGTNLLELLFDLMVLPEGVRLRDRVSHGEVSPTELFFSSSSVNAVTKNAVELRISADSSCRMAGTRLQQSAISSSNIDSELRVSATSFCIQPAEFQDSAESSNNMASKLQHSAKSPCIMASEMKASADFSCNMTAELQHCDLPVFSSFASTLQDSANSSCIMSAGVPVQGNADSSCNMAVKLRDSADTSLIMAAEMRHSAESSPIMEVEMQNSAETSFITATKLRDSADSSSIMAASSHLVLDIIFLLLYKSRKYRNGEKELLAALARLDRLCNNYRPHFHPAVRLGQTIERGIHALLQLPCCDPTARLQQHTLQIINNSPFRCNTNSLEQFKFLQIAADASACGSLSLKAMTLSCADACSAYRGRTLFRPREEYAYLRLLTLVAAQVEAAVVTATETASVKMKVIGLRSRQRVTLSRMVECLPQLQLILARVLLLLFHGLLHKDSLHEERKVFGIWRKVLQGVENIASQASSSKNKWDLVRNHLNTIQTILDT